MRSPTSLTQLRSRSREREMNPYRYKITVEALAQAKGERADGHSLCFEVVNHDDILATVDGMRARLPFDEDTIASLGVGLKLFSAVTAKQWNDPMFAMIGPAMNEFVRGLKQGSAAEQSLSPGRLL
jgi:hypothetical protein